MKRAGQSRKTITILTAALMAAGPVGTMAQDAAGPGIDLRLNVGTRLSVNDNKGLNDPSAGTTTEATTTLGFGLRSETRSEILALGVSTALSYADTPGASSEFDLREPLLSGSYTRLGANSSLTLSGSYQKVQLDEEIFLLVDEDLNPVDIIVSAGDLERTDLGAVLKTGIDGPLELEAGLRYQERDYSGTVNPSLYDRTTLTANVGARLVFSPVLSGAVSASQSEFEAQDAVGTERTSRRLRFSATYALSPVVDVTASAGFNDFETRQMGAVTDSRDGATWSLGATRTFDDGSLSGSVARVVSSASDRTEINLRRSMELPRGNLAFGLGYSLADQGDDVILASVDASRDLPTGQLTARLSQSARASDDNEDILVTRLNLRYRQQVNQNSSWTAGFGLARTEQVGPGAGGDSTRANLDLSYNRALTSEWDWSIGYRARFLDNSGGTANSNEIFTGIDRSFSIRP